MVPVAVAQVADQVVLVVLEQVVPVAALVDQAVVAQVVVPADLVVLAVVVLEVVVLAVVVMDNAVHQRRSHVPVVAKTSMKCCHRQPRRIRKAMLLYLRALSLSSVVPLRKSLHQS